MHISVHRARRFGLSVVHTLRGLLLMLQRWKRSIFRTWRFRNKPLINLSEAAAGHCFSHRKLVVSKSL